MTTPRAITIADLAKLVTRRSADYMTSKWTIRLEFPASEPVSIHSWQADLLAAIPSAPVVPVVSDAAVPSAPTCARCRLTQREHQPGYAASRCAYTPAAVPSATREEVAEALTGFAEAFAFIPEHLADDLLARFTITPRADR